jgi:hypothetical protein
MSYHANVHKFLLDSTTEAMRINSSGKVGIGTNNPSVTLDVYNDSGWGGLDIDGTAGGEIKLQKAGTRYGGIYANDSTGLVLEAIAGTNTMLFYTNSAPRMRIDSSGDISFYEDTGATAKLFWDASAESLGIGTNSPAAPLHLGAASPHIDLGLATGNRGKVGYDSNNVYIGSTSGTGQIHFKNNINSADAPHSSGDTKMVITDSGVGIGTDDPVKQLEVWNSSDNDFVSVGVRSHSVSTYQGIHFGYAENNNLYRKSAIVFERTDLTSNNAQGKVHILNGPQSGELNATLADRKITIMENGNVEVPFIRAGAWAGGAMHTNGTDAAELGVSGGRGYLHGYDRTNSHYIPLTYDGVEHSWATSGGDFKMNFDATGNLAINVGVNSNTSASTLNGKMDDIAHTGTVLSNNGPVVMGRSDGSDSGASGAAAGPSNEPRCIRNWFTYAGPGTNAGSYVHMKTNLDGGTGGNVDFTMSVFTYHDYYAYGSNYSGYGTIGWHNWSGTLYNVQLQNYGNWNLVQSSYLSSDGYVVLVAYLSSSYAQFSLDWAQWGGYNFRNRKITNVAQHSAATGKY